MSAPIDSTRCPLCGEDNQCGAAAGAGTCWCFATRIPEEVLERIPPEQRSLVCVCPRCASAAAEATGASEPES